MSFKSKFDYHLQGRKKNLLNLLIFLNKEWPQSLGRAASLLYPLERQCTFNNNKLIFSYVNFPFELADRIIELNVVFN